MQVLSIQNNNFNKTTTLKRGIAPQMQTTNSPMTNSITKSVYAQGMGNIAFGGNIIPAVKTSFEKEIAEQPQVLKNLINKFFTKAGSINMDLKLSPEEVANIRRISIIASGSSKHAAEMAQNVIEKFTQTPVTIESASEFMGKSHPYNSKEDLTIFVSQSGMTADTLKALSQMHDKNIKTIAITNNSKSTIANTADSHISIDAGEENAVAATKTVTSSILSLMCLGLKLGELKHTITPEEISANQKQISLIPEKISEILKDTSDVKKAAKIIADADNIYYYAKGSNTGTAKEGALKLIETTGKRTIADSSSEALHGTFASIKPENPVLEIVVGDKNSDTCKLSLENINEMIKKRNIQNPIIMKTYSNEAKLQNADTINPTYIGLPEVEEMYSPILTTIRMQQITNEVTKILNINPDNGGNFLTKYRGNMSM